MESAFGQTFMFLTKLAWNSRTTLPLLITAIFLAMDFRMQVELDLHLENDNDDSIEGLGDDDDDQDSESEDYYYDSDSESEDFEEDNRHIQIH